jgi:hypothetical protein
MDRRVELLSITRVGISRAYESVSQRTLKGSYPVNIEVDCCYVPERGLVAPSCYLIGLPHPIFVFVSGSSKEYGSLVVVT